MGLLTNSKKYRDFLELQNTYKPQSVYDLNNDELTKSINLVQKYTSFDLRQNFLISAAEAIIDNTAIVRIGAERLAISAFYNYSHLALQKNTIVNGGVLSKLSFGLLGKGGNYRFKEYTITNISTKGDNGFETILNGIKKGLNVGYTAEFVQGTFVGKQPGTSDYYNISGEFTKNEIKKQTNDNFYRIYGDTSIKKSGLAGFVNGIKIDNSIAGTVKEYDYIKEIITPFGKGNPDKYLETQNGSANKTTFSDESGEHEITLAETLGNNKAITNAMKEDGFGYNDNITWDGKELPSENRVRRGLLYYTNQITKTNTDAGINIKHATKEFNITGNIKNEKTWKGKNKCRSFVKGDEYLRKGFEKALRSGGNKNEYSVLKDSVVPKMFPEKGDEHKDFKRFMFSFENLAFDHESYNNLPYSEQGAYGGRVMWFPFYGVKFTENLAAKLDEQRFIGRIEPVFSYAGASRNVTLSFTLIMDYPLGANSPIIKNNQDLANYYDNCNNVFTDVNNYKKPIPGVIPKISESTIPVVEPNFKSPIENLIIYFGNNSFEVDPTYESTGKNKNFNDLFNTTLISFLDNKNDAKNINIIIEGNASKRYGSKYNTTLGFKRAYDFYQYIIKNSSLSKLTFKESNNFYDSTFVNKKVGNTAVAITTNDNKNTKFTFTNDDRKITFTISSNGEDNATGKDDEITTTNAIDSRNAKLVTIDKTAGNTGEPSINVKPTVTEIEIKKDSDSSNDTIKESSNKEYEDWEIPFKKSITEIDNSILDGFEYRDSFRPAYHSQTPYDFHNRLTFLNQLVRPGKTIVGGENYGKNSIFGKMPICVLRLGDFLHTKIAITTIDITYEQTYDLNPEGHGVQPMIANVSMNFHVLGGQSMQTAVDVLQRAVDTNFYANSTFKNNLTNDSFNSKSLTEAQNKETTQVDINRKNKYRGFI
jgi:outer membrane protein OmpA-like peptidoglycan-associated protein